MEEKIRKYKFTNDISHLSEILKVTGKVVKKMGLSQIAASQIKIAVDEVCTNVIKYAFKGKKSGEISLHFFRDGNLLKIVLIDNGEHFNPLGKKLPDLKVHKKKRKKHGLGIYIVRKIMDDLDYKYDNVKGNIFTMIKKIM